MGGFKPSFGDIYSFDLYTHAFTKLKISEYLQNSDKFFDSNYILLNKGKTMLALGRFSIHEINLTDLSKTKTFANGYKMCMTKEN